jgi:hypothetical protein
VGCCFYHYEETFLKYVPDAWVEAEACLCRFPERSCEQPLASDTDGVVRTGVVFPSGSDGGGVVRTWVVFPSGFDGGVDLRLGGRPRFRWSGTASIYERVELGADRRASGAGRRSTTVWRRGIV